MPYVPTAFVIAPDGKTELTYTGRLDMAKARRIIAPDKLGVDMEHAALHKIAENEKRYPVELAKDNATKYNRRE